MPVPPKKFILRHDSPCPCKSGKTIGNCRHLGLDGRLRKSVPSLRPPLPKTGYSHPACYLRDACDCSQQISREHYISRSVLDQLGEVVRLSGAPWQRQGEGLETPVANLTAKILCKRHNEALSPLDAEAGNFFAILKEVLVDLDRRALARKPIFHLSGGDALELWLLKVACGLFFGGIGAKDGVKVSEDHRIDTAKVIRAIFERGWDGRAGLYFKGTVGDRISIANGVAVSTLTLDQEYRMAGARIALLGFAMDLVFDETGSHEGTWTGLVRRPTELVLKRGDREHHIILTWPPGTPEHSITMEQAVTPLAASA